MKDNTNLPALLPSAENAVAILDVLEKEVREARTADILLVAADKAAALHRAFKPVKDVSDRAGGVWIEAEVRLRQEYDKLEKASGTRGQFRGSTDGSGGSILVPPENDGPTIFELGLAKKRIARAKHLADIPARKRKSLIAKLKDAAKAVNPAALLAAVRKENKEEKKHAVATAAFSADGPFGTVVIDPPWEMQKIDREVRPNQDAFDYPTMSEEELFRFWRTDLDHRTEDDCHLFMWTTQKHLPAALRLVDLLEFKYVLTMVWHKSGGFQPVGLPQYNCEFVVYARKGAPIFVDTKEFPCCFDGQRREHSRKPDTFYDMIRRVTGGSRIDVFSREMREGFAQYGNEIGKFK